MSSTLKTKGNATYTCRDFAPDDILLTALRPEERGAWAGFDLYIIAEAKMGHPGRTILANDIPIASYGLLFPWPSLAILWLFVAVTAHQHRWALWPLWKQEWATALDTYPQLMRVEAYTLKGDAAAWRVAQRLGFQPLCEKRYYGPQGATYLEWEWLRHG